MFLLLQLNRIKLYTSLKKVTRKCTMNKTRLIFISGMIWTIVGCSLSILGTIFLSRAGALPLILLALPIGYAKGRFIMKKSAMRQLSRLSTLKEASLKDLFSRGYVLLLAIMMCLGFLLRFCPLMLRGTIDIAVGFALIIGSLNFYKVKKEAV
ncbi:MAG: hypothetical protein S4CHLAM45_14910 [Chlamydiales bacterium]|nr:hypothetical protein [Chlamydiales bacterium]MCH9620108.1 hypothetical protein [Chlamydiales bacterium]MCH9623578.1 hypothetical protein [Chlamydiales bacterium]